MPPRFLAGTAFTLLLLAGPLPADPPLKSGPPVGARNNRSGFFIDWLTGNCAGQNLCPV
jgi:hypothetical protein